eukprot:6816530-Karenia_brevis.AAC.1
MLQKPGRSAASVRAHDDGDGHCHGDGDGDDDDDGYDVDDDDDDDDDDVVGIFMFAWCREHLALPKVQAVGHMAGDHAPPAFQRGWGHTSMQLAVMLS